MLTTEPTLTIDPSKRRVVQEVTQGRFAGLFRIMGCVEDLGTVDPLSPQMGTVLPSFVDNAHHVDHFGPMVLVELKSRYVLYREVVYRDDASLPAAIPSVGGEASASPVAALAAATLAATTVTES